MVHSVQTEPKSSCSESVEQRPSDAVQSRSEQAEPSKRPQVTEDGIDKVCSKIGSQDGAQCAN